MPSCVRSRDVGARPLPWGCVTPTIGAGVRAGTQGARSVAQSRPARSKAAPAHMSPRGSAPGTTGAGAARGTRADRSPGVARPLVKTRCSATSPTAQGTGAGSGPGPATVRATVSSSATSASSAHTALPTRLPTATFPTTSTSITSATPVPSRPASARGVHPARIVRAATRLICSAPISSRTSCSARPRLRRMLARHTAREGTSSLPRTPSGG